MIKDLQSAWNRFGEILYPATCLGCGGPGGERYKWICEACERDIPIIEEPCCRTCGYPFYGKLAVERNCPRCQDLQPAWSEGRSLMLYQGPAREWIQDFKYRGGNYLLRDIHTLFRNTDWLQEWVEHSVLVPVPLHTRKERERGYNQSFLIARELSRVTHAPCIKLLKRVQDTPTQTRLSRQARARNVRQAFAGDERMIPDARLRYILIDDVFTTGATLNACAETLYRAGIHDLRILTLAHG